MYKVQDYYSEFVTAKLLAQLYARVGILLTGRKHLEGTWDPSM